MSPVGRIFLQTNTNFTFSTGLNPYYLVKTTIETGIKTLEVEVSIARLELRLFKVTVLIPRLVLRLKH